VIYHSCKQEEETRMTYTDGNVGLPLLTKDGEAITKESKKDLVGPKDCHQGTGGGKEGRVHSMLHNENGIKDTDGSSIDDSHRKVIDGDADEAFRPRVQLLHLFLLVVTPSCAAFFGECFTCFFVGEVTGGGVTSGIGMGRGRFAHGEEDNRWL
jgi:hypothetical protein